MKNKIYSGYGKYSDPFKMFHSLFYCRHLLKAKKIILFLIIVHSAPHLDRQIQICRHFSKFIKKEKLNYQIVISIINEE